MAKCFSSPRYMSDKDAEKELEERRKKERKITQEQMQQSVNRLTHVKPIRQETGPVVERRVISGAQLSDSVTRLHYNAITHKQQVLSALEKKNAPVAEKQVLDAETMANSLDRIYSQALNRKKDMQENLRNKLYQDGPTKAAGGKKLTKEDQEACNERAYSGPMQRKKEIEEKLNAKYIEGTTRKYKKMNASEWKGTVERLSAAK